MQGVYNVVKKIELGNENICARSCFRKYAVLLVVRIIGSFSYS